MSTTALLAILCLTAEIHGPNQIAEPQPVIFNITGTPAIDLDKPLREQITWLADFKFIVNAASTAQTNIQQNFNLTVVDGELGLSMELTLTMSEPGVYVIIGPDYVNHRLTVGGSGPDPQINPTRAVIILESKTQSIDQSILTSQLRNDTAWSRMIHIQDPDQRLAISGQPDPGVQLLLTHGPIPRVYLLDDANNVVGHFALPNTWADTRQLLQQHNLQP